ncbi:MAG: hypothetical protein A3F82_03935 [Deltaproteobacteria bacterium RIFCSPLOWO2_12_FULL_44_12]|nr:MAG: hypothetical protein A2712_08525 [Deltaproteobacteria bacterium RIFCSPHIGHO2_01_FULL_43_49]OGQ14617.1 MAG: hypothetical protein A3D22_08475 [Deltaproteobacteria bacterium RIFCSPHIGHO2_02_FULL_44_53]OGQ28003.1 MAG: hypothetical protein A3D98_07185 [Deltaproteobacteria bacterium RIFCSPHIGHO2_12_FULL_44_21]OGQ31215.1 MAG: hypothetical protein A2979_07235 [Deltaproteobacteria bacterium RIFCSPLOWO2_01_FULL_45_74]OGQ43207.1 MAG: hypothetical protein A3I70_00895 [Deltaproteobacteria bacterium 
MKKKDLLFFFLLGATVGSLLDGIHTHSGTTFYPTPLIWKMAWWVPLLFGSAAAFIGFTHFHLHRFFKTPSVAKRPYRRIGSLAIFILVYFISGYLPYSYPIRSLIMLALYGVTWIAWERSWQSIILAFGTAFVGCFVESKMSTLGLFGYTRSNFFGIPQWLPILYLHASAAVGQLCRQKEK